MLASSTTNMTGFRAMWRGFSLWNASRTARFTIGPWKSGCASVVISEQPPSAHSEVLDDRPERQRREERERANDQNYRNQQNDEERRSHREGACRFGHDLLFRKEASQGQCRYDHRE